MRAPAAALLVCLLCGCSMQALPQYLRLAEEATQRVSEGVRPPDIVWRYDSPVTQANQSLRAAAQRIAPLLARLNAEQIAHIEQRLAEGNRGLARRFLRGSERARRERRAGPIAARLEDWVGRLSQVQMERIRAYSHSVPLFAEMRDADNRRLHARLLALLRSGEVEQRLPELVADWQRGR